MGLHSTCPNLGAVGHVFLVLMMYGNGMYIGSGLAVGDATPDEAVMRIEDSRVAFPEDELEAGGPADSLALSIYKPLFYMIDNAYMKGVGYGLANPWAYPNLPHVIILGPWVGGAAVVTYRLLGRT